MNRRTFVASLAATPFALGVSANALAQTPDALDGALPGVGQLTGVQGAVARIWGLDIDAELRASPGASPLDFLNALTMLNATVMEFDTADSATEAFSTYAAGIGAQLQMMGQGGTPTVTESELSDVGDEATSATLETVSGDFATYYRFDLVRNDTLFFLCSGLAGSEDPVSRVDDLARWLVQNGKKDGDPAIFVAEGGSSGGLWGYMPLDGDPVVSPLVTISDETLLAG